MNRVNIQPAAVTDVEEAALWYEAQEPGLGIEFILALDASIDLAVAAPHHYEDFYLGIRRVLLKRFPYSVYFVVENRTVDIIAVLHQHQSPVTWQLRR